MNLADHISKQAEQRGREREIKEAFLTAAIVSIFSILVAALVSLVTAPFAIWSGWVLSVLWRWFVVPLGVAALSVPHAIGIVILIRLLLPGENLIDLMSEEQKKAWWPKALLRGLFGPAISLAFGWLVRYWMRGG